MSESCLCSETAPILAAGDTRLTCCIEAQVQVHEAAICWRLLHLLPVRVGHGMCRQQLQRVPHRGVGHHCLYSFKPTQGLRCVRLQHE